jgi:[acyl-carrier-protein] S-malonyltransferase
MMRKQMVSPVRWIDSLARLWDYGARHYVECGPKGALGRMVEPVLQAHAPALAAHSAENPAWTVASIGNMRQLQDFS